MPSRDDIVMAARKWLGTPFRHQGRALGRGVDCAGVVIGVGHDLGLTAFDSHDYGRMPDGSTMRKVMDDHMDRATEIGKGDVILFAFSGIPHHVAIVSDVGPPPVIVHSWAGARRCVEHRLDANWRLSLRGVWRFRGVN